MSGTSTIVYVYQGLNIIYEKNLTSGQATDLYYGDGMQLAKSASSSSYYYLSDELRSTRMVVNGSGSIVFQSDYIPFGLNYGASGLVESIMYTGQVFDPSTGLYYYKARFYDPATERFVTEDGVTKGTSESLAQNRYLYVQNNPEINSDPSGQQSLGPPRSPFPGNDWVQSEVLFFGWENASNEGVVGAMRFWIDWSMHPEGTFSYSVALSWKVEGEDVYRNWFGRQITSGFSSIQFRFCDSRWGCTGINQNFYTEFQPADNPEIVTLRLYKEYQVFEGDQCWFNVRVTYGAFFSWNLESRMTDTDKFAADPLIIGG